MKKQPKLQSLHLKKIATLKEAAVKTGFVSATQFDEWVKPEKMV